MPMELPKAKAAAIALFETIRPTAPEVAVRSVFGQPAAFLAGNMFLGVFGEQVFVRLSDADRTEASRLPGVRVFEPMPGRPMREYVVLPAEMWSDTDARREWIRRSMAYAAQLPPKASSRGSKSARGKRPPTAGSGSAGASRPAARGLRKSTR